METSKDESRLKWGNIKDEYGVGTTEELFGLNDPVEYQCSFIDEVVKKVKSIQRDMNYYRHDEKEDLIHRLDSISYDIGDLDDEINDIRAALEEVREWGVQWKELCKRLILQFNIEINEIN
ncbi:hypothetical protein [Cytobacillus praedii]|uniref:Uncharacterized protein n=1 Tax=Cytobacillus praedii TaxID=1742358 RepID=A0A4R1AT25_9BACI|nr:hypothetical protein [Cytobacillus praedii]TCJ00006.1 hypothetical protein E0Y62_26995 [Cytobacillus praedii]